MTSRPGPRSEVSRMVLCRECRKAEVRQEDSQPAVCIWCRYPTKKERDDE
jgi:hypothetical protein